MMLSYAQNMEDVLLARLFAGQASGFYVDIGGGHAVADNVTFDRYLAGWRGVVVEPQESLARLYAPVRPRDTVISALAGRAEGSLELFEATRFHGLSTASASHAAAAEAAGVAGRRTVKPVTTLAALCEAHAPAVIDVLKIDVEGHEADVIAGGDWTRYRPRVVLAEAIEPLSMQDSSHRFEPQLLAENYLFAFFDGLNRWYVSEEASGELLQRFPPERLDWGSVKHLGEFGPAHEDVRHPDHALAKRLAGAPFAKLPFLTTPELVSFGVPDAEPAELARIAALYDGGYIVDDEAA